MDVKEYLKQAYYRNMVINDNMQELNRLEELSLKCQGFYNPETLDKIERLKAQINSEIDGYVDEKKDIRDKINLLSDGKEKAVIIKRYLMFKSWEQIAEEMGYTVSWVHEIHKKAFKNLCKVFENT